MTQEEKIKAATNKVLLAIQSAALEPEKAKTIIASFSIQMRETWEGYFTELFSIGEINSKIGVITKIQSV